MDCLTALKRHFCDNGIAFQTMTHLTAYSAQGVAAALGVKGKQVAKVTLVNADNAMVMLVLPASYLLDFTKLRGVLGAKEIRLAKEEEFSALFPDCETGAMPPFGHLYGVPMWVDCALAEESKIYFQVGTYRDTIQMTYKDYARLARPRVADFALHSQR